MAYYVFKDEKGEWRWYLQAKNGKKIAVSGEGYNDRADCLDAIDLVKVSMAAPINVVEEE